MASLVVNASMAGEIWETSVADYATAHDANTGTVQDEYPYLGQEYQVVPIWFVSRGGLAFDTSALPDDAVISAATISLNGFVDQTDTDFDITVVSGADLADTLVEADFHDLLDDTTSFGTLTTVGLKLDDWNVITLNATGRAAISKTDTTRFGLRSSRDISSTDPKLNGAKNSEYVAFYGIGEAGKIPKITITYTTSTTVTTQTCQDVVGTTATGRGTITDLGGANATAHGHCWAGTADPTIASEGEVDNGAKTTTGTFTSAITGLTAGTGYYTRAYATNAVGTSYGANVYFIASLSRAGYIWMEGSNFRGFDENAVERKYIHTADVDDTPSDGATTDPISSNWAYDHVDAADPHTVYFLLAGETTDAKLYSGADLIVYSDAGSTEKARIDGATGNITTAGTITVGSNGAGADVLLYGGTASNSLTYDASENVLNIASTMKAADNVLDITVTDATTLSSGYGRGAYINYTVSGSKSGEYAINGLGIDMTVSEACPTVSALELYTATISNKTVGNLYPFSIYCEDIGTAVSNFMALDIGINSTNLASSRHTGIRIRNHAGTAKSAILIEEAFTDTILRHSPSGVDLNLITLDNSSGAIFYWDDSEQKFRFNKGLYTDGSLGLGDDQFITFGGVASLGWETADADANLLALALPDGGGTDSPTLMIGAQSVLNFDLGTLVDVSAIDEPNIIIIDADADSFLAFGYMTDDSPHIHSNRTITIEPNNNSTHYITFATGNDIPSIYGTGSYLRIGNANTTQHTLNNEDDLMVSGELEVGGATFIDGATTFTLPAAEHILIDGRTNQRTETLGAMRWNFTPATGDVGSRAIYLDVNANSVNDTMGMVIDYTATGLAAGFHDMALEINVETSTAGGGTVGAMSVEKSGIGILAVEAIHASAGVIPLHQESGTFGNLEIAWRYALPTTTWTNVTAACNSAVTDAELFTSNGDILYIGDAATFDELNVTLATVSSKDIKPTFAFSAGGSSWLPFTPNDTTTGFRNTGIITWEIDELVGWATDTVHITASKYWIRITRTKAGSLTAPIEDRIQVAATTEYGWDENAAITVSSITAGGDISMGANSLKTTNLLLKEGTSSTFYLRNTADNAYVNLTMGDLQLDGFITMANGYSILGELTNDAFFALEAMDTDNTVIEVARAQGAADPYFAMGGSQEFKFYESGIADLGSGALTNVNIDSGTIDGVTIGGTVAPTVTDLGSVATCDINGGTLDGVTITAPNIDGAVTNTGAALVMPGFSVGTSIGVAMATEAIHRGTDARFIQIFGGTTGAGKGAVFSFYGVDSVAETGQFRIATPNVAENTNVTRLTLTGKIAEALATWTNVNHWGLLVSAIDNIYYANYREMAEPAGPSTNQARLYAVVGGDTFTDMAVKFQDDSVDIFAEETTPDNSPLLTTPSRTNLQVELRKDHPGSIRVVAIFPDGKEFNLKHHELHDADKIAANKGCDAPLPEGWEVTTLAERVAKNVAEVDEKIADYEDMEATQDEIGELNALKQVELARLTKGEIQ